MRTRRDTYSGREVDGRGRDRALIGGYGQAVDGESFGRHSVGM